MPHAQSIKLRESAVRRALRRKNLRLEKTPARHWSREYYGAGYQVIDDRNVVISGCNQREYEMTLRDVEAFSWV